MKQKILKRTISKRANSIAFKKMMKFVEELSPEEARIILGMIKPELLARTPHLKIRKQK